MAAPASPLHDAPQRLAALDPTRSFLVQAPAGSGKTELLMQRFLVLLAHVDQPESVVALTFTRKAAAEMRLRILRALDRARDPEPPPEPHLFTTWQLARQALLRDHTANWNLLASPQRLRILTIDALNLEIVARLPWLSRLGASFRPDDNPRPLYEQAARRTLHLIGQPGPHVDALRAYLTHCDNYLPQAITLIANLLEKREQWMRYLGAGGGSDQDYAQLRARLEDALAQAVQDSLHQALSLLPQDLEHQLTRLLGWPDPLPRTPDALPSWTQFADAVLTSTGTLRKRPPPSIPAKTPAHAQFQALLLRMATLPGLPRSLQTLRKLPDPRYSDRQWQTLRALFTVLPLAAAQLRLEFQAAGTVDFVEIAQAAQLALGDPAQPSDLALFLGERIQHLLIDEFQDTSISQLDLLESIALTWQEDTRGTLFLVGDPMQSIYRFRQAEVGLFFQIRERGVGGIPLEPLTLSANFRSVPEIVEPNNHAFARILPSQPDPATGAVPFEPSLPTRPALGQPAIHWHPFASADYQGEAARAAQLALNATGSSATGSCAILVRARSHLAHLLPELKRRRIPFRGVDIEPLSDRPVVQDLLALTRALLHPDDRASWFAILRAPWCGATLDELHALTRQPGTSLWRQLQHPHQRFDRLTAVLRDAFLRRDTLRLSLWVERTWLALGGHLLLDPTETQEARRLLNLLEQTSAGGSLVDFQLLESRTQELFAEPDLSSPGALQVMTIHKAKGLEFDTVILPGLGEYAGGSDNDLIVFEEQATPTGSRLLVGLQAERGAAEERPLYAYLHLFERDREAAEISRLLYVAMTRARSQLHLLGQLTAEGIPASGSLLHRLWPALPVFSQSPELPESPNPPAPRPENPGAPRVRRMESFPAHPTPPETAPPKRLPVPGPAAPTGTLLHRILEQIAQEGLDAWPPGRVDQERARWQAALAALGIEPAVLNAELRRVQNGVRHLLSTERGRWLLRPHPNSQSEWEIAGLIDGQPQIGRVDRYFEDDGTAWIVDFKLEQPQPDHENQLRRYARILALNPRTPRLRAGLYYVLSGHWEEIDSLDRPSGQASLFD
jgi:ATP-dependent exoDNAse (exonuclease V) beta subunit